MKFSPATQGRQNRLPEMAVAILTEEAIALLFLLFEHIDYVAGSCRLWYWCYANFENAREFRLCKNRTLTNVLICRCKCTRATNFTVAGTTRPEAHQVTQPSLYFSDLNTSSGSHLAVRSRKCPNFCQSSNFVIKSTRHRSGRHRPRTLLRSKPRCHHLTLPFDRSLRTEFKRFHLLPVSDVCGKMVFDGRYALGSLPSSSNFSIIKRIFHAVLRWFAMAHPNKILLIFYHTPLTVPIFLWQKIYALDLQIYRLNLISLAVLIIVDAGF